MKSALLTKSIVYLFYDVLVALAEVVTPLYRSQKVVPASGPYVHNYWFGNIYVLATSAQQQQLAFK